MQRVLGVDWGPQNIGLALSIDGEPAVPLKSVVGGDWPRVCREIARVCYDYEAERVVVGRPSAGQETFEEQLQLLEEILEVPVELIEEELTSHQAREEMFTAGVPTALRKKKEHAFAAGLILNQWLEENVQR